MRPARPSTLFCAFLTLLNDRLGESLIFPLLPFLLASFTSDGRTLGLLAGSYAVAQFLATPWIGALSDRYGRRPVIAVCVAGSVLGLSLFSATVAFPWSSVWPAAQVAGLPLVLLSEEFPSRRLLADWFAQAGVEPDVRLEINSTDAILATVRASALATIQTRRMAGGFPELRCIPLKPALTRTVAILWRRDGYRSTAARALATMIKQAYARST